MFNDDRVGSTVPKSRPPSHVVTPVVYEPCTRRVWGIYRKENLSAFKPPTRRFACARNYRVPSDTVLSYFRGKAQTNSVSTKYKLAAFEPIIIVRNFSGVETVPCRRPSRYLSVFREWRPRVKGNSNISSNGRRCSTKSPKTNLIRNGQRITVPKLLRTSMIG